MNALGLIRELKKYNVGPYIEVPCSILAPLITRLLKDKDCEVLNPVSEAVAMGLASGSYLATKKRIPVVLMQNSGLCNSLNAVTSLNNIYNIPVIFIISWRGEPGTNDAPEHYIMGKKLKGLLKLLDIPYVVLSEKNFKKEIRDKIKVANRTTRPVALILRKGLLQKDKDEPVKSKPISNITKRKALGIILDISYSKAYFVTANGLISREVFYHIKDKKLEKIAAPFYMLGSMGHVLSIALGIERHVSAGEKKVIALDGDGGCLMHLGSLTHVGQEIPRGLIHIVLDDGVYASTGGQPTVSKNIDFCKIAQGCGYKNIYSFTELSKLKNDLPVLLKKTGPTFVHVLISDIGEEHKPRVSVNYTCEDIKNFFTRAIKH